MTRIYSSMRAVPLQGDAVATMQATKDDFRRQAEQEGVENLEAILAERAKTDEEAGGVVAAGCVAMPNKVEVGCGSGCGCGSQAGSGEAPPPRAVPVTFLKR